MDLNSLYFRQQVSQFNADNAGSDSARHDHQQKADAYFALIARARQPAPGMPSRAEAADELREQAASCRKLALSARTPSGSKALRTVAHHFESDAARIDPLSVASAADDAKGEDSAALVRVRLALECQMRNGFGRGGRSS